MATFADLIDIQDEVAVDYLSFGDGAVYPMDRNYTETAYVRCVRE